MTGRYWTLALIERLAGGKHPPQAMDGSVDFDEEGELLALASEAFKACD